MNEQMELNAAMSADARAAETQPGAMDAAQAAPAAERKEYVPPRMQVIPLGPQRMLATSGAVVRRRERINGDCLFTGCYEALPYLTADDLLLDAESLCSRWIERSIENNTVRYSGYMRSNPTATPGDYATYIRTSYASCGRYSPSDRVRDIVSTGTLVYSRPATDEELSEHFDVSQYHSAFYYEFNMGDGTVQPLILNVFDCG